MVVERRRRRRGEVGMPLARAWSQSFKRLETFIHQYRVLCV
jgi:hypothetical protein